MTNNGVEILLVEDSPELACTIAASLEKSGGKVTPVNSAQEAERLALSPGSGFDVVLTDVVMPGSDGIALATRLRKRFGLDGAQVILGHKTLSVTQVYAEKNVEAAQRIMAAVG